MSDSNGNLLFYTDGATVWNKLHQVMANGTLLSGAQKGLQNVVINASPWNNNLYYIHTTKPVRECVVDIGLAVGLGSVTTKNDTVQASHLDIIEHITSSNRCSDIYLSSFSSDNQFGYFYSRSYSNSLNYGFVNQNIPLGTYKYSWIKSSPGGRVLSFIAEGVLAGPGHYFTGFINSGFVYTTLFSGTSLGDLFSCEFSGDGTKFYVSSPGTKHIYQWDLCAGSDSAIINSLYTISTGTTSVYGLQLAPDGKIYGASNPSLSVINNPNVAGAACGFTAQQQSIGTASCGLALPNFNAGYFQAPLGPVSFNYLVDTVGCKSATFSVQSPSSYSNCTASGEGITAVRWNFGDPISGTANTSTVQNVVHNFSGAGTYSVQLLVERGCHKDTIVQQVTVPGPWPWYSLAGNFTICANESASITASGTDTYSWSGNVSGSVLVVSPTVTTNYTVVGQNSSSGCRQVSNFSVTVWPCTSVKEVSVIRPVSLQAFPSGGELKVQVINKDHVSLPASCKTVSIKDLSGRAILSATPEWNEGSASINISQVPAGVYFISLEKCPDLLPVRFMITE